MGSKLDPVIAALRVALHEAEQSDDLCWRVETANRWLRQLPGVWRGKWRRLMLRADSASTVRREYFIGHVRATLAYLEEYTGSDRFSFWSGASRQIGANQVRGTGLVDAESLTDQKSSARLLN